MTKKKKPLDRKLSVNEIMILTNYLTLSIALQNLVAIYGDKFTEQDAKDFVEGYIALMREVADKRQTIPGQIRACKDLTGIDVKLIVDSVYRNGGRQI